MGSGASKDGTYKLSYFNGRGRAETARLCFAAAGLKFTDNKIEQSDWPKYKPKTPLGSVPVLEFNGKELAQSLVINRFLAERFGLMGSNSLEKAKIDEVMTTICDFAVDCVSVNFASDKAAAIKNVLENKAPTVLKYLKKTAECNPSKSGYLIGTKTFQRFNWMQPAVAASNHKAASCGSQNLPKNAKGGEKRNGTKFMASKDAAAIKNVLENKAPTVLKYLKKTAECNPSKSGYLIGTKTFQRFNWMQPAVAASNHKAASCGSQNLPKNAKGGEKRNGTKFMASKDLSLADLAAYKAFEHLQALSDSALNGYEILKTCRDKVAANPNIAKYLKDRAVTPF